MLIAAGTKLQLAQGGVSAYCWCVCGCIGEYLPAGEACICYRVGSAVLRLTLGQIPTTGREVRAVSPGGDGIETVLP